MVDNRPPAYHSKRAGSINLLESGGLRMRFRAVEPTGLQQWIFCKAWCVGLSFSSLFLEINLIVSNCAGIVTTRCRLGSLRSVGRIIIQAVSQKQICGSSSSGKVLPQATVFYLGNCISLISLAEILHPHTASARCEKNSGRLR